MTEIEQKSNLPNSFGKTWLLRVLRVYSILWKDFYGFEWRDFAYGKYGRILKLFHETLTEYQIAALLIQHFNWHGATGEDEYAYKQLVNAGFPIEYLPSRANIYEAYIRNTLEIDFDDVDKVREYVNSQIIL